MLSVFAALPRPKKLTTPVTEGISYRLHYRVTCVMLMACSALVTCIEWIGNDKKISCVLEGPDDDWTISPKVLETYCFVIRTFTIPKHWGSKVGHQAASMGVGSYHPHDDQIQYKSYYQWVPFVLFLQAATFYLPHLIFKSWEGGKVQNIISGLHQLILDRKDRAKKEKILASYFVESLNSHNLWALKMLFIELLNLINVIGNIYLVDIFLDGEFSTYGFEVLNFIEADPETRIDPMAKIFPKVTKCSFYKYGPSGTVQTHDSICVLPINSINEKIYVLMWFWFVALAFISVLSLVYHVFLMLTPAFTKMFLRSRALDQHDLHLDAIGKYCEVGDWKLLYILSRNMEPVVFAEFLRELFKAVRERKIKYDSSDSSSCEDGRSISSSTLVKKKGKTQPMMYMI